MRFLLVVVVLTVMIFASNAFAQKEITVYDPADALHPLKILGLVSRPPIALLQIFIKGGYWVLDSEPTRRAFNIEYHPSLNLDEDY